MQPNIQPMRPAPNNSQPNSPQQPKALSPTVQRGIPPQQPNQLIDWLDQFNKDPVIVDLRQWLTSEPERRAKTPDGNLRPITTYTLPNGDVISCVLWKGMYYISGTDVVKILLFRFQHIGRQILNTKKFEEGVFSDLRNMKPGQDAVLEEPKSPFLEFLYKNNCIRTQKKQKVFFWYRVPHDTLFREAVERDLKREASLYQTAQLYNMNQRMMRAMAHNPMAGMFPMPAMVGASPTHGGLPSIAPQPMMDPQAYYYAAAAAANAAAAMSPQLPIQVGQPSKFHHQSTGSGTVDPSMLMQSQSSAFNFGDSPSPFSHVSNGPFSPALQPNNNASVAGKEDASLLSDFADPQQGPDFNVDQFVDFTSGTGPSDFAADELLLSSPTGDRHSGLTL